MDAKFLEDRGSPPAGNVMRWEVGRWILGFHLSCRAHRLSSLAVLIESFLWLRDPPRGSFSPGMFAECFDMGPQYKMVSDHLWISGSLSPKEERHMLIKGKCCVSLRVEWSQDA